jgi:ADP-heptose:LPS heptosyltransferase
MDAALSLPDWPSLRRLLVVRLDNLGDVIMTGPALRAMKLQWPALHLTLLASPGGAPAAALLPWVDEVWIWRAVWQDLGRLAFDPARELGFLDELRRRDFDAAVIFTSFSQSPHPVALACALADIPVRIGRSRERGHALTCELPRVPDELHQAERNLTLIEAAGVRVLDRSLEIRIPAQARLAARELLVEHGVTGAYVLLSPWASCQARTFDPRRFALAARLLAQTVGLPVVVCGAVRDRARASELMEVLGANAIDLVGATDVCSFASLIADAQLVLTQNTAALHLADALAVPQLVMYSGTELESQWAPRTSAHRLLRRETGCSPCYRFECPFQHACLDFTSEQVADAGSSLLGQQAH